MSSLSGSSACTATPTTKTIVQQAQARKPIWTASLPSSTWRGVWFADVSGRQPFWSPVSEVRRAAICPTRVSMPVRTTRPLALPDLTVQEEKTMVSGVSFSGAPSFFFLTLSLLETSSDSPVRSISLTLRSVAKMRRLSAGTTSPVLRTMMSPRTMSEEGISTSSPSRMTVEMGDDRAERASRAPFAEFSVRAATMALRKTMMAMAMEST
mmetsp:Transcript_17469/g.56657  ORF Transcript_17469/g.56657 Transcript_17469/m.56657 type:complete len:210 (-) Transcript_17469:770-1399(-)